MEGQKDPQLIVNIMMRIHQSVVPKGATPRQYMSFVQCYKAIVGHTKADLQQQRDFLAVCANPRQQCLSAFQYSIKSEAACMGLHSPGGIGETS